MRKRILYWGDSPTVNTGFGNVSRLLLKELAKNNDITVLGINYRGGYYNQKELPIKIYPAIYNDFNDWMGYKRFVGILSGIDPEIKNEFDTLIVNFDVFHFYRTQVGEMSLFNSLKLLKKTMNTIIYAPIDTDHIPPLWLDTLKVFDRIVVPSNFGKKTLILFDKSLKSKITVIPYEVDIDSFESLYLDRPELKKQIKAEGKFVIGMVARNSWRKDIYHVMSIFKEFHARHKDSFLYLHTNPIEPDPYAYNIYELATNLGLQEYLDFAVPQSITTLKGVDQKDMKEIYNVMDVNLSCTMGEGLGLPLLESMLCRTVNLAPNNTTIPELMLFGSSWDIKRQSITGRGFVYQTENTYCIGNGGQNRFYPIANPKDALDILEWIYNNQGKIKPMLDRAEEYAKTFTDTYKAFEAIL